MVIVYNSIKKPILKLIIIISCLFLTFLIFSNHQSENSKYNNEKCDNLERIDAVYTWVNGSDPKFLKNLNYYVSKLSKDQQSQIDVSPQRYTDRNELKYSLRSLEMYAPWINHIYIVTNGQIPNWLDLNYEKVTIVTHKDIYNLKQFLPTFSSPAIEANLHRIPGLSKNFLYFNDDIFLQSPIYRNDFVSDNRGFLIYLSWPLLNCNDHCLWNYIGDGNCDRNCMTLDCQYDGGDCFDHNATDTIRKQTNYDRFMDLLKSQHQQNLTIINYFRQTLNNNLSKISEFVEEHNRRIIDLNKRKRYKLHNKTNDRIKFNIDTFGRSLQYTNRILNRKYGTIVRKVPAHAPILINKSIVQQLQNEFFKEVYGTIQNRFRNSNDFQYSFAYYYYLINKKQQLGIDQIFDQFDTDRSGSWSYTELRTVLTRLYDLPLNDQVFTHFWSILLNCSNQQTLTRITKDLITNCSILSTLLQNTIGIKNQYNYEIIESSEDRYVTFKMLTSNKDDVLELLDNVRKYPKKFVCLNDNFDPNQQNVNELINEILYDFYQSLFPHASKFELLNNNLNEFTDYDMYRETIAIREKYLNFIILAIIIYFLILYRRFRKRICAILYRAIFYFK